MVAEKCGAVVVGRGTGGGGADKYSAVTAKNDPPWIQLLLWISKTYSFSVLSGWYESIEARYQLLHMGFKPSHIVAITIP